MIVSPSCDRTLQLMAGAQCRFGHSRRSVSADCSQDSVPLFALRHAPEGTPLQLALMGVSPRDSRQDAGATVSSRRYSARTETPFHAMLRKTSVFQDCVC